MTITHRKTPLSQEIRNHPQELREAIRECEDMGEEFVAPLRGMLERVERLIALHDATPEEMAWVSRDDATRQEERCQTE